MSGRLIVIEGLDGSGKATQTALLCEALGKQNIPHRHIAYPDYDSLSSGPVRMYLKGELGDRAGDVNAYAASVLYTADRVASYYAAWKRDFDAGVLIVADRYTTSNAIHQMSKLPQSEWPDYLAWLSALEYDRIRLPRPDAVLYLDMPPAAAQALMHKRYEGDDSRRDVHERDNEYLCRCYEAAQFAAKTLHWHVVPCGEGETPLPSGVIHTEIMSRIQALL